MSIVETALKLYLHVVGAGCMVFGIGLARRHWRLIAEGERITGKIVG